MTNVLKIAFFIWNLIIFSFSTFISIYEGSKILNRPSEWNYTAFFSKIINNTLTTPEDILMIDYIIYSAKYSPIFPLLMLISAYLIVFQIALRLLKNNKKATFIFCLIISIISITIMILLSESPTPGLSLISNSLGIAGTLSLFTSIFFLRKNTKTESKNNPQFKK